MIKVTHPQEACNLQQTEFLKNIPAETVRFHELMFTFGNTVYRYNQMAQNSIPKKEIFNEWLKGLPEHVRNDMEKKGFETAKTYLPFCRYVNERNEIGLTTFAKELMGAEFEEYIEMVVKPLNLSM